MYVAVLRLMPSAYGNMTVTAHSVLYACRSQGSEALERYK